MAAFFPFYQNLEAQAKVDCLGIFVIGPVNSIRMAFCPYTLQFCKEEPERTHENRLARTQIKNERGQPLSSRRLLHEVVTFTNVKGQGYCIGSYEPQFPEARRQMFVRYSCTPVRYREHEAFANIAEDFWRRNLSVHLPCDMGHATWDWVQLPGVEQVPLDPRIADPDGMCFGMGGHHNMCVSSRK